jgi:Ca2+:H+ antiporter
MFELVKSGLIGSIIGNLLLVLGICILIGGLKFREQIFNKNIARTNFSLFFLALSAIIIISIYRNVSIPSSNLDRLSFGVACVLIIVYILGLVFSLITHRNLFVAPEPDDGEEVLEKVEKKKLILFKTIIILALIIVESEILVSNVEYIMERFKLSESFLGIIIIPFVGNIIEYSTAVMMALKNRISLCIEIAVGSGIQISLFVFPLLVILGCVFSTPLNFVFNSYHITSLIIASGLSFFVFQDGKTYWIEGAILLACYFIVALGYFFM